MKGALGSCLLALLAVGVVAQPTSATTPTFAYSNTTSCLNTTKGFTASFVPIKGGTSWTEIIQGVGSGTTSGSTSTVTEFDTSTVTAVYGDKPKADGPAGNAYTVNISSTVTGPNSDGSYTLTTNSLGGSITAGPDKGRTFTSTVTGAVLKMWIFSNGMNVAAPPSPFVQTITVSNGTKYYRVCSTVLTSGGL